jgi:NADPH:quinone reductase-like Zn-dependent oxidoreductase
MKAVRFHQHGGPEVFKVDQIPEPACGPDQVVVRIKAAGINHLDIWVRKGIPGLKIALPHIDGCDGAGVVHQVGANVTELKAGDRVVLNPATSCGVCEFCQSGEKPLCTKYSIWGEHTSGTYVELMAVPRHIPIKIPDWMSFEQAAATPLSLMTAWRMLISRGRLKASEDVLVWSAGAGVGMFCVQIAKQAGARVIATASTDEKCDKLKSLGADVVYNHATEDVPAKIRELTAKRGVDLVVDYIGKETFNKSILCMRRGGRLVTCGATSGYEAPLPFGHVFYRQLEIIGCTMGNDKELFDALKLVFTRKMTPVIDRVLPVESAGEAHAAIEARKIFGKVILAV